VYSGDAVKIGRYELLDVIGQGGNARVWRARSDTGRLVALKIIHPDAEIDDMERFQRERRLQGELGGEEKGFVALLDAGSCEQGPYIVMPLLEKKTLRDVLNEKGPLPVGEALDLVSRLTATIALAHERGVVHRDLKPGNVLFSATGRPLVADLGLAKHVRGWAPTTTASLEITRSQQGIGTPLYMAPEQMVDFKRAGPAADVFALGVILYECLTGNHARQRADPSDPTRIVTRTRIDRDDVPVGVRRVMERALAEDPKARYADAGELLRALHASGIERHTPRRTPWIALVSVAVLSLSGGLAVVWHGPAKVTPVVVAPAPAPPPRPVAPTDRSAELEARLEEARAKLDGSPAEAVVAANASLKIDPSSWEARRILVMAYVAEGQLKRADDAVTDEIAPLASAALAHAQLGAAYFGNERWDDAIRHSECAIRCDPGLDWAWSNRGQAYYRRYWSTTDRADLDAAERDASHAIELEPKMIQSYIDRARIRLLLGRYEDAAADAGVAIALHPGNVAYAWALRARARFLAGDPGGASVDTRIASALDKRFANALHQEGLERH
jgi:tetratricopeptide (TPR) repeat protein